jgi:MOSC domain-containing protein YiiM
MKKIKATVVSVHTGASDQLNKDEQTSIIVELDGVVGDRHRSFEREAWAGNDKQPEGTVRRNERQWSAVSVEELAQIAKAMDLTEPLTAAAIGANLCIEGIPELSRLPRGTTMRFPSEAELQVENFNPPCLDMGAKLAATMKTRSGVPLEDAAFSKASKLTRGIVGVVEVAGIINPGDEIEVTVYEHPSWLAPSTDE